ncbi:MAG: cation diffusion facilitator family transporter [Candidatus Saccharicenans sp.]|jgi:cation diffusion facilitator family transporter|nr:cation diffusion facilitator family transporter [Candidatus Saccharicenans sp.]MDH7575541.1 cation diffusion facilitator family transporter [Candidatus Saccharicenans sp.]
MTVTFAQKKRLAYYEGYISIFINLVLFLLKFLVGRKVNSVAMMADAWHTLSDCLTSIIVVVGFWMASRPADSRHAFGHGRSESIASIIIGTLLAVVGFSFLYESVVKIIQRQGMGFSELAVIVFAVSAVMKEGLAQFAFWTARKTGAGSLRADAWHHRSDAVASVLIVAGVLFSQRLWWLDGVLGIGVSLLILHASYDIIRSSASYLMGEAPSDEKVDRVHSRVRKEFPQLDGIHHVHVHQYGDHHEVTAHLTVPGTMSVDEAHNIASRIEEIVEQEFNGDATVHVEPEKSEKDED